MHQLWVWVFRSPRPHPQLVYDEPGIRRIAQILVSEQWGAHTPLPGHRPPPLTAGATAYGRERDWDRVAQVVVEDYREDFASPPPLYKRTPSCVYTLL